MKLDKMLTPPVKASVISFALVLAAVFASASDLTWVGGASGQNVAENWDPAELPAAKGSVRFTNDVTVACSSFYIGTVIVSDGCEVTINSSDRYWASGNADSETLVYVGEGGSLTFNGWISGGNSLTFVKDGPGLFVESNAIGHWSTTASMFKAVEVRGGTLKMQGNYPPRVITKDGYVHICTGATFLDGTLSQSDKALVIESASLIEIDEGGTLDLNNKIGGTIRALAGEGAVINAGTSGFPLTFRGEGRAGGSQSAFAGTFGGYVKFAPTNGLPFVVTSSTMLENATVSTMEPEPPATALAFAADIGKVAVKNAQDLKDVYKFDLAGNPLTYIKTVFGDYTHTADGDDDWSNIELVVGGNVTEKSSGTWTLGSLTMNTGKIFAVDNAATGKEIHLCGGTMTGVTFTAKANYDYYFDGVDLETGSAMIGVGDRTFHQAAGKVRLTNLNSASSTSGAHCTNDVYYYISGGTLVAVPKGYLQLGLGLEASGDAHVVLSNGTYNGTSTGFTLEHGDCGYTVRVRGNALVEAEDLYAYYYRGSAVTTRVEIAENGVLAMSGGFGALSSDRTPANVNYANFFSFDGGTFRSTAAGDINLPRYPDALSAKDSYMHMSIGAGGATFDVPRATGATGLTVKRVLHAGVATGKDGGFTKTGIGYLTLDETAEEITGPISVKEGVLNSAKAGNPFGIGSVILNRAVLSANASDAQAIAAGEGSTVTLAASGSICKNASGTDPLTIGPEGATSTPLVRQNHAVLGLMLSKSISQDNVYDLSGFPIRVNGGIGDVPVFTWATSSELSYAKWGKNRGLKWFRHVSAAADGTLYEMVPVATNEIPVEATAGLVRLMGSSQITTFNLTADAAIGSLELYGGISDSYGGLQIAKDKTLTVGGGAGTVATVVLNNNHLETSVMGAAQIGGAGTLDFGAAEGLVVANGTYYNGTAVRRPSVLACRLSGTGGVTFAVPYVFDATVNHSTPDMHAVSVRNSNDYAGGTWIEGLSVGVRKRDSLGVGTVTVTGDAIAGGTLLFEGEFEGGAFSNALVVSGEGHCYSSSLWGERAAVRVEHDVRLTGGVTLTADTKMIVEEGSTLAFDSAVSGTGKLTVKGCGTASIGTSSIACAGGVDWQCAAVEIRPADAGSIIIDAERIPVGATIVVDPTGAVDGCGVVTVDGDLNLATVSVRFSEKQRFYKGTRFTFLKTTGTLIGTLDPSLLPSDKWHFEYEDDAVTAVYDHPGLVLLVW